ncbi:uncharacterized protein LOC112183588 [Rosa chinensis]|uniref:uncharacterized protein LOC112183588 n=1 Tax=Rosa chinensis TaxID=74649 RepID=UPI000D089824|nr:uncharacterized protein LOC112183588 [Rosa chinensis]
MDTFKKVTGNKGFDDATLCHLFSETLDGEAMSWLFECPPGSMDLFSALSNAFLSRFILMTDGYHNSSQLFSVSQGVDESLKSFVTRWRTATSRCQDLDKTMVLATFKQRLHMCKDQIPPPPPRKFTRVGKPRNIGKWCKHHKDSGHNTNDCNALKTAIESLSRDGRLEQYKVRQPPSVVANVEPVGRINTIEGSAFIGSLSHRARKRYERANHPKEVFNIRYDQSAKMAKTGWGPITFSEEEERGIHSPHDDPFLIDAVLDRSSVGRVLVDSGSVVNVIFNGCYKQLQCNNKLLQDHEPLLSFSGDVTQPSGSDYMPLSVGQFPTQQKYILNSL